MQDENLHEDTAAPDGENEGVDTTAGDAERAEVEQETAPEPPLSKRDMDRIYADNRRFRDQLLAEQKAFRDALIAELSPKPEAPQKPSAADFDDDEAFQEALVDWKLDMRERERQTKQPERAEPVDNGVPEPIRAAAQRLHEAGQQKHADFTDAVNSVTFGVHYADAVLTADDAVELAYHLAQNPDIVDRLNRMTPAAAGREVAKIEQQLAAKPAPPVSGAPRAPRRESGGTATPSQPASRNTNLTLQERVQARLKEKFGAR